MRYRKEQRIFIPKDAVYELIVKEAWEGEEIELTKEQVGAVFRALERLLCSEKLFMRGTLQTDIGNFGTAVTSRGWPKKTKEGGLSFHLPPRILLRHTGDTRRLEKYEGVRKWYEEHQDLVNEIIERKMKIWNEKRGKKNEN